MRNEWILEEYTCVQESTNDRKDRINSNSNNFLPGNTAAGILDKNNDRNITINTPSTPQPKTI